MPLALNPKLRARLIEVVAAAIPGLHVEHGRYIDRYESMAALKPAEEALPDRGALKDQITAFIDHENPFTEFVVDSISEELQQLPFEQDPTPQSLSEIEGYGDSKAVAERVLERF